MRDTDRREYFALQHLPGVGLRSPNGLREPVDRDAQQVETLVAVAHDRARLPRIGAQVPGYLLDLLLVGRRRIPSVVVASEVAVVDVIGVGLPAARTAKATGHIGGVDEPHAAVFGIQAGNVVADLQSENIGAIDLCEM